MTMQINVSFTLDEKDCDPDKLKSIFIDYLDEMLEIGFDENDFPFVIKSADLHSFIHEVRT